MRRFIFIVISLLGIGSNKNIVPMLSRVRPVVGIQSTQLSKYLPTTIQQKQIPNQTISQAVHLGSESIKKIDIKKHMGDMTHKSVYRQPIWSEFKAPLSIGRIGLLSPSQVRMTRQDIVSLGKEQSVLDRIEAEFPEQFQKEYG